MNAESRSGYNYYTPTFRTIGDGEEVDIQEIQLPAEIGPNEAVMQFLGANSHINIEYVWLDAETAEAFGGPAGKGGWFIFDGEEGTFIYPDPVVTLKTGDSVLIDMAKKTINNAGQVGEENVTYAARAGYNYIGNPFPVKMNIQNIQLATSIGPNEAVMQFLEANSHINIEYVWLDAETAEAFGGPAGKGGWFIFDGEEGTFIYPDPEVTLEPSQAVLVDCALSNITVYSPVEL